MVTNASKTLNAWIMFCKTRMATVIICYFFSKDTYKLGKFGLNILNVLKLYHWCILHEYLFSWALNFNFNYHMQYFFQQWHLNTKCNISASIFLVNVYWVEKEIYSLFKISKQWFEHFVRHSITVTCFRKVKQKHERV